MNAAATTACTASDRGAALPGHVELRGAGAGRGGAEGPAWLPLAQAAGMEADRRAGAVLPGTRFLRLDLPFSHDLKAPARRIGDLRRGGWQPLLFAPERHPEVRRQAELSRYLRQAGGWLALDVNSLLGRNGNGARVAALRLVRLGWYSFCAPFLGHPEGPVAPQEVAEILRPAERRPSWQPGEVETLATGRLARLFGFTGSGRSEEP